MYVYKLFIISRRGSLCERFPVIRLYIYISIPHCPAYLCHTTCVFYSRDSGTSWDILCYSQNAENTVKQHQYSRVKSLQEPRTIDRIDIAARFLPKNRSSRSRCVKFYTLLYERIILYAYILLHK